MNRYSLEVKLELEDHELSAIEQNYHGGGNKRWNLEAGSGTSRDRKQLLMLFI